MLTTNCGAGPAVHLVNLIPPPASLATPSIPLVHEILTRANLPLETIALAVCVLDSLDSKFSLSWRLVCPLAPFQASPAYAKRHTIPAPILVNDQLHIDSVRPELIILASLVIAVKFLEDCQTPTTHYASCWGHDLWTCEQINVTEWCIMESLGYRILPLWDPELIGDALGDMRRAAKQAALHGESPRGKDDPHKRSMSSGKAVPGLGLQLTPAETPNRPENAAAAAAAACWPVAGHLVCDEARAAFMGGGSALTRDSLRLPPETTKRKSLSLADGLDVYGTVPA